MNPLQPNSGNFMDRNTLLAIVLVTVMFVIWQNSMRPVAPQAPTETVVVGESESTGESPAPAASEKEETVVSEAEPFEEQTFLVEGSGYSVQLSNRGMGLNEVRLNAFTTREGEIVELGAEKGPVNFGLKWEDTGEDIPFVVEQEGEFQFKGESFGREWTVVRHIVFEPETFSAEISTTVQGDLRTFPGLRLSFSDKLMEREKAAFLFPSFEHQDVFSVSDGKERREILDPDKIKKSSAPTTFGPYVGTTLASISQQYFSLALIDNSQILPTLTFEVSGADETVTARLVTTPLNYQVPMVLEQKAYFGAKSLDLLSAASPELPSVMDLGFFASLAKPLLRLLSFFEGLVGNWGLAIIVLTLLVRGLLLPLNISSFRSMKRMQQLQEPMKVMKEKYKDDRQKLNEEMAALFRREKVNPIGGCLPMLIQLPIFIALYQVFSKSIELYQAPFILWIQDLSSKDPYYVLPILMGVTMFLQQLLTPSAMDPTQKKIMMIIPLVFSFMMLSLPSGLTLYIFVSTLFGVIQQFIMTRDSASAVVATAKA